MRDGGETVVGIIALTIGGFVVSMLALFSMFGGFILVLLMMAATPFVIGFLVVEAIFGKQPVYVSSVAIEDQPAVTLLAPVLAQGVSVRVIRVDGVCPTGYRYDVGDTWTLNGKVEGNAPLCPAAYQMLEEYAKQSLSETEAVSAQVSCTNGHLVEFEVMLGSARPLVEARR